MFVRVVWGYEWLIDRSFGKEMANLEPVPANNLHASHIRPKWLV